MPLLGTLTPLPMHQPQLTHGTGHRSPISAPSHLRQGTRSRGKEQPMQLETIPPQQQPKEPTSRGVSGTKITVRLRAAGASGHHPVQRPAQAGQPQRAVQDSIYSSRYLSIFKAGDATAQSSVQTSSTVSLQCPVVQFVPVTLSWHPKRAHVRTEPFLPPHTC